MSYMDALGNLGRTTERELVRLLGLYTAGQLMATQFVDLATVAVSLGQQQGRIMAEVALMAWLEASGKRVEPVAAPKLQHYADSDRVRRGLETIVAAGVLDPADTEMRVKRFGYSETVESSQRAFGQAMQDSGQVTGWTRGLEPDACELCQWWSRDGRVWPVEHSMPTHKGCICTPIPSDAAVVPSVGKDARWYSADRELEGSYTERQSSGYVTRSRKQ